MTEEISSPCVAVCQLDDDEQYCIGCYRTPQEIEKWANLTEEQKLLVIEQLSIRRKQHENR